MAKAKKARAGRKKVKNLRPKDVEAAKARTVAGGADINFTKTYDKSSPVLF